MELLLAVIRENQASLLDGLLPAPPPAADPDDGLRQAVATLWRHLSAVLGEPSPVRKIIIQELAAHPEIRQRALELHEQMAASVACYLAQASPHPGEPGPGHEAAARLLTITAGMAPLLGEPSLTLIPPDALGALIATATAPARRLPGVIAAVRPEQSREDTEQAGVVEAEPDDDERLYRDRPPHWDSVCGRSARVRRGRLRSAIWVSLKNRRCPGASPGPRELHRLAALARSAIANPPRRKKAPTRTNKRDVI
jgi:hypothetical protein